MPRNHRMTRAEFQKMAGARPVVAHGRYASIVASSWSGLTTAKAACVVSKKVSGSAALRNRLQRRCREILRPLLMDARAPRAIVVRLKKDALHCTFEELRAELVSLLQRLPK